MKLFKGVERGRWLRILLIYRRDRMGRRRLQCSQRRRRRRCLSNILGISRSRELKLGRSQGKRIDKKLKKKLNYLEIKPQCK